MVERIAAILSAIGVADHRLADLARDILDELKMAPDDPEVPDPVLTDAVYFLVFSSSALRREVNYYHPLDSLS